MASQSLLRQFLTKLTNEIRTCHCCGSLFTYYILCSTCWENLPREETGLSQRQLRLESETLSSLALMDWISGQNRSLSILIEALKGGRSMRDFENLALEFQVRRLTLGQIREEIVFVPAPSRDGHFDHARAWAEALGNAFSGKVISCLQQTSVSRQKELKKADRSRIRFESSEKFSLSADRIIFVDDVVTSGSTAWAAYVALGRPRCFEIWSIAYRHLATHR